MQGALLPDNVIREGPHFRDERIRIPLISTDRHSRGDGLNAPLSGSGLLGHSAPEVTMSPTKSVGSCPSCLPPTENPLPISAVIHDTPFPAMCGYMLSILWDNLAIYVEQNPL